MDDVSHLQRDGVRQTISLVVPVYNELGAIEPFLAAVERVMAPLDVDADIVFVDDGSQDATCDEILDVARRHAIPVRLIALSRNFGKEAALTAGIDAATGDAVIPIDVDLQDPPELIPAFIDKWREGYKVVYGRRTDRREELVAEEGDVRRFLHRVQLHFPVPNS